MKSKNCILCPYKNQENCLDNDKCYSLSNIYYGTIIKWFPFNIIHKVSDNGTWYLYKRDMKRLEEKYGDINKENDEIKFIWGMKSFDDLSSVNCGLMTMNDIDITYDKKREVYYLGIETAYIFDDFEAECKYLKDCLKVFADYMDKNNLDKNQRLQLFMSNPVTSCEASTIEELYTNFRIFVNGYCSC